MSRPHAYAFELRGFEYARLNGIYLRFETPEWTAASGAHRYATYWKVEQAGSGKQMFMYWQADKARHAVTPRRDEHVQKDLWPEVRHGVATPGLAFFRPEDNHWLEWSTLDKEWCVRQWDRIMYKEYSEEQVQDLLLSVLGIPGSRSSSGIGVSLQSAVAPAQQPSGLQSASAPASPTIQRRPSLRSVQPGFTSINQVLRATSDVAASTGVRISSGSDQAGMRVQSANAPGARLETGDPGVTMQFVCPVVASDLAKPVVQEEPVTPPRTRMQGFRTPPFRVPTARTPTNSRIPGSPDVVMITREADLVNKRKAGLLEGNSAVGMVDVHSESVVSESSSQAKEEAIADVDRLPHVGWSLGDGVHEQRANKQQRIR